MDNTSVASLHHLATVVLSAAAHPLSCPIGLVLEILIIRILGSPAGLRLAASTGKNPEFYKKPDFF